MTKQAYFQAFRGVLTYTMQYRAQHINIPKERNHMIISINEKLVFDKVSHPFMTKNSEEQKEHILLQ